RRPGTFLRGIERHRTEGGHVPLRPVDLVDVDVVDLQPLQAEVHRLGDVGGGDVGAAAADPVAPTRAGDLGGDHQLAARAPAQPAAEVGLGAALGGGVGRHRVHLGGIDE